ncbi:MAG: CpaD family pilus assembly lipoprotein [Pseudomonadota bacterium]
MTTRTPSAKHIAFFAVALGLVTACSSPIPRANMAAPDIALEKTPLDFNQIQVQASTEVLEIVLAPGSHTLTHFDVDAIEDFVTSYRERGHGQLVLATPENGANASLSRTALTKARTLAWSGGVSYEEMEEKTYDARGADAPMLLAFDVYEVMAPECLSLANYDMSDISSNNEPAYFGCAVRANIAAMLDDPGDLLGERELERRDPRRVSLIAEAYRAGG